MFLLKQLILVAMHSCMVSQANLIFKTRKELSIL